MEVYCYEICYVSEMRKTALQGRSRNKSGNRVSEVRRVCFGHYQWWQYAHKQKADRGQAFTPTRLKRCNSLHKNILGGGIPLNATANVLLWDWTWWDRSRGVWQTDNSCIGFILFVRLLFCCRFCPIAWSYPRSRAFFIWGKITRLRFSKTKSKIGGFILCKNLNSK